MSKLLYTPDEAAEVLGMSRTRLYRLINSGEVESVKIGGLRRIPVAALERFVQSLRLPLGHSGDPGRQSENTKNEAKGRRE